MKLKSFSAGLFLLALMSPVAFSQTDLGLSLYGAFNGKSSDSGVALSPANSAGGLVELRHLANPLLGFEATYSYNRANQKYTSLVAITCPTPTASGTCPVSTQSVSAAAHEVTADWVPSLHIASLRPFGVLGVGVLLNVPTAGQSETQTSTKVVYVYGAGLDWGLLPHLGLRFQYRGNLYKAPDVSTLYTSLDKFTSTAEPMIGAYFRF